LLQSTIGDPSSSELDGKTVYQRSFFRLATTTTGTNKLVIEERLRYKVTDPLGQPDFLQPVGSRDLVLRRGDVPDGKIGDSIGVLRVPRRGGGWERTVATALVLTECFNDRLSQGRVLQLAAAQDCSGVATVTAGVATAALQLSDPKDDAVIQEDKELTAADDIVPANSETTQLQLPADLMELTLSDNGQEMAENLDLLRHVVKQLYHDNDDEKDDVSLMPTDTSIGNAASNNKITIDGESFPWNAPPRQRRPSSTRSKEYDTVVVSDLNKLTFPEVKSLCRTIAHAVAGYTTASSSPGSSSSPQFLYVAQEEHCAETVGYLQQLLSQGYCMQVDAGSNSIPSIVSMECIRFALQTISDDAVLEDEDAALDDLVLQVQESRVDDYRILTAQHDASYAGDGSGEVFFPMENGLYEQRQASGNAYLEPEEGSWLGQ